MIKMGKCAQYKMIVSEQIEDVVMNITKIHYLVIFLFASLLEIYVDFHQKLAIIHHFAREGRSCNLDPLTQTFFKQKYPGECFAPLN